MGKKSSNKQQMSAVPMNRFGINTVVLTEHKDIERYRHELTSNPTFNWDVDGKGKAYLHQKLHSHLKAEDRYFEANLDEAGPNNQRWIKFMDDCVFFAVLDSVVRDEPLHLMHPTQWESKVKCRKNAYKARRHPCLLPGVPVYTSSE